MDKFSILNVKKKNDKKVFLGGTCNNSIWRKKLIKLLNIDYFNPVVDNWSEEAFNEEIRQKQICDYLLYVITPSMTGVYSIAEVVDDSNKNPNKTIFCYLDKEADKSFDAFQIKSLDKVGKMVQENGGIYYKTLEDVAQFLNK